MASALRWDGLDEFKDFLRLLPDELADEAGHIVMEHATLAASAIRSSYPRITGELQDGVAVEIETAGRYGAAARVVNRAKFAMAYEYGTEARHYYTKSGAKHETGRAPAGNKFWPRIEAQRLRMYEDFVDMLKRHGLDATNAAA